MFIKLLKSILIFSTIQLWYIAVEAVNSGNNEQTIWSDTWTDKLRRDLLRFYDRNSRPVIGNNLTYVTMNPVIKYVDMDFKQSIMTINAWISMTWQDEKLHWNSSQYGSIKAVNMAFDEIWMPDIVAYNSADGNHDEMYGKTGCVVRSNGMVHWIPPAKYRVFCDVDLTNWPFGEHTCSLRLGSWTYDGNSISMQINQNINPLDMISLDGGCKWEVTKVTQRRRVESYSCNSNDTYEDIHYSISIKRKIPTYNSVVIIPALVVVLLTLSVFWLPPESSEKFMLSGVTLVIICIVLMTISNIIPVMSDRIPLIVLFYSNSLGMVTLSMVFSVMLHNLAKSTQPEDKMPKWIKLLLDTKFGTVLRFTSQKDNQEDNLLENSIENNKSKIKVKENQCYGGILF
ncbi:acetylcholine receptor subunit alpha-type acr-16-like isoform X2 [Daktulosphaira vitifoliae]|uniref:acetylcholine receptor subunit alpha-type acr-16-like isoform X2 n=1 Tax=Daktulosphaira vitifoliae TaxID=58002 RepID=UPI0021AAC205|nr:acetylcholine receptor subunit alpha-type acr-16-like isoform X2 [Daktulosphaira vitifoliae]